MPCEGENERWVTDGISVITKNCGQEVLEVKAQSLEEIFDGYKFPANPVAVYGKENVQEAMGLLKANEKYGVNSGSYFEELSWRSQELQKINSNERWKTFKYDEEQGRKIKLKTINEAMAAIECEEKGLIQGPIIRSQARGSDFIDGKGQQWDEKTFPSYSYEGKYIFDVDGAMKNIKQEFLCKNNLILNITHLNEIDRISLYEKLGAQLSKDELEKIVVVHTRNSSLNKTSSDLINFFGK